MDPGVGYQVGLELCQIHIESTVKPQGSSDGGYNLTDQSVEVGVGRSLNVQVPSADIVDGLVVDHEGTIGVLQSGMGGQDSVVRLHNGSGNLRRWVDGKLQLALLSIVHTQSLQKEGSEPRSSASSEGVEHKESLETGTLVGEFPDPVQTQIYDLLADGVVTSGVVVGSILLSRDELLGVEELSVGSSPHFIDHGGLQVQEHSSGNVFPSSSLTEEGVESVVSASNGLVRGHLTVRLDAMFQAVKLPARVTNLDPSLTNVNRNTLPLKVKILLV